MVLLLDSSPFVQTGIVACRLRGKDDALDAIKALKTQQIGLEYAPMYIEWSSIESVNGNERKALSIIQKGINEGAQPAE